MPPGPDFDGEGQQREGVFDLEGPLRGLVAEEFHPEQSTRPAAERPEQRERGFGDAPPRSARAPFVEAEREERHEVETREPDGGECVQGAQAR